MTGRKEQRESGSRSFLPATSSTGVGLRLGIEARFGSIVPAAGREFVTGACLVLYSCVIRSLACLVLCWISTARVCNTCSRSPAPVIWL